MKYLKTKLWISFLSIIAALNLSSFQQFLLPKQIKYLAVLFNMKINRFHFDFIVSMYKSPSTKKKKIYRININYHDRIRLSLPVAISCNCSCGKLGGDELEGWNIKPAVCSCANVTLIAFAN